MSKGSKTPAIVHWIVVRLSALLKPEDIAIYTGISLRSVERILHFFKLHGTINHKEEERKRRRQHLRNMDIEFLLGAVRDTPDLYLDELQDMLATSCGRTISRSTVWRVLNRAGFTLKKSGATRIIHTVSLPASLKDPALYWKVHVDGTKVVLLAAIVTGVHKLVFTSSEGVVFNGLDIIDIRERLPPPGVPLDARNESKAKTEEAVLAVNSEGGLLTVALRPAGIFGPGDQQFMSGFYQVYEHSQNHFQIRDNTYLFDWTYEEALINHLLLSINLITGQHHLPTSQARPLGPYITLTTFTTHQAHHLLANFALEHAKDTPAHDGHTLLLSVADQAFFINGANRVTFGHPLARMDPLDTVFSSKCDPLRKPFVLSKPIGLTAATTAKWFGWFVGKYVHPVQGLCDEVAQYRKGLG